METSVPVLSHARRLHDNLYAAGPFWRGATLLSHAEQWASTTAGLEWIDLQALSENELAIRPFDGHLQAMRMLKYIAWLLCVTARAAEVPDSITAGGRRR